MTMFRMSQEALDAHKARIGSGVGRVVRGRDSLQETDLKAVALPASANRSAPKPVVSKYKNKKVQTDEANFSSEKEHRRYQELKLLEKAGVIRGLELQKRFVLAEGYEYNGKKVPPLRYFADFVYEDSRSEHMTPIVEDCKGYQTGVYKIKRHLMFAVHGIQVFET